MKSYIAECDPKGNLLIFSKAIKLVQKLPFSHYALVLVDEHGLVKTVDASGRTLHQESLENFKEKYNIIRLYEVPETEKSHKEFREWLHPLEGQKYGYMQVVGLLLQSLKLTIRNIFSNGTDNIICNEFILRYLRFQELIPESKFDSWDLVRTRKYLELHYKYQEGESLLTTRL